MPKTTTEPTPSEIQAELYYKAFARFTATSWLEVCEQYATGDQWPSIDTLKLALNALARLGVPCLPPPTSQEMPKEVRAMIDKIGTNKEMP